MTTKVRHMYQLKNGLLYKDGKPVFGLGVSYYASYHERKVPVPRDGDRMGEMHKDLKGMVDAGFNIVRFAALGDISYDENGDVVYDGELMDAMAREADKLGIATMIRLQGYSSNLSDYRDTYMIDAQGKPMDDTVWYDFIRDSLFHKGILKDTHAVTEHLAKHFKDICNVACYQTYNEPHYPTTGMFDYHPDTIEAYRQWLVEKGIMTREAAQNYKPPATRPQKGESPVDWIHWRLFSMKAMSNFLGDCSDVAYNASGIETMTCLTIDPSSNGNAARGVSFYDSAQRMNALGITHYYLDRIPEVYMACLALDMGESAASLYQKPMWLVEYDARTNIPLEKFRKETYLALGAGCKGIMYYQWRGDHIFPDAPEGNGYGIINYDGTPTPNFENAKKTVEVINKLSDVLVNARKLRTGVAMLYSDYAFMHSDAVDNDGTGVWFYELKNSWLEELSRVYCQLRAEGISPDIVRAQDLKDNVLGTRVLYTASMELLSEEERQQVQAFKVAGGTVYTKNEQYRYKTGYIPLDYEQGSDNNDFEVADTLYLSGITAPVRLIGQRGLLYQTLKGNGYYIICITNAANPDRPAKNTRIETDFDFRNAYLYTFGEQEERELLVKDRNIMIDTIIDGAIIVLKA